MENKQPFTNQHRTSHGPTSRLTSGTNPQQCVARRNDFAAAGAGAAGSTYRQNLSRARDTDSRWEKRRDVNVCIWPDICFRSALQKGKDTSCKEMSQRTSDK